MTAGQAFTALPDGDVYAPQVGWSDGFPVGREPAAGTSWLAHCYGMVGVGRDNPPDPGTGAELYAVIGHAPRHLDRNLAVVGRVVQGMDLLAALPRGTKAMGFYDPEKRVGIQSVRLAADLPAPERLPLEVLRTDTPTWQAYVASRRHRRVELCNVAIAVRVRP
jgi:peptidylprolyl isomerase